MSRSRLDSKTCRLMNLAAPCLQPGGQLKLPVKDALNNGATAGEINAAIWEATA
jgi:alkylhydroperoxidase/carboxymuconolactone decarboxylase family protein YurZ